MFEHKYKSAFDKISINEEVLNNAINNASNKTKVKNPLKIALIACLSTAIVCTCIFSAFKLGKSDDTQDNIINDDTANEENNDIVNNIPSSLLENGIKFAENQSKFDEILENINRFNSEIVYPEQPSDPADDPADDPDNSYDNDLSTITNSVQATDINKCDVIKTDGKYTFILRDNDNKILIVASNNGMPKIASEIKIENHNAKNLLLIGDTLAVICLSKNQTVCIYYDVSDIRAPKIVGKTSQGGGLYNCIAVDEKVYIISNISFGFSTTKVLKINDNDIDYKNTIIMSDNPKSAAIITAYDTAENRISSNLTVFGNNIKNHINKSNVYLTSVMINNTEPAPDLESARPLKSSKILKISLNEGNLKAAGGGYFDGVINDRFSLDEKDDILRIISYVEYSFIVKRNDTERVKQKFVYQVFCLDNELKQIGASEDFAINDATRTYGFLGNIAYVHTLPKEAKLYAIDLTNPTLPVLITEYEDIGQISNLQIYGNSHIWGMNCDTNSHTGITSGIELSIYNVGVHNFVEGISKWNSNWTPEEFLDKNTRFNERGIILDSSSGIICVPYSKSIYDELTNSRKQLIRYMVFNYDGKSIIKINEFEFTTNDLNPDIRSVRIDKYFYLINDREIIAVSVEDFSIIGSIEL